MSAPATATSVLVEQNPEIRSELNVSETSTYEDIAQLAYTLWQRSGCPSGTAESDWLEAERILREQLFKVAREASFEHSAVLFSWRPLSMPLA